MRKVFFDVGHVLLGNVREAANVGQDEEHPRKGCSRERERQRADGSRERKVTSGGGATRLTNRSIVGRKTIRSLTARPGYGSLSHSFSRFLYMYIYAARAFPRWTRKESQFFRSRIYLPLRRTSQRLFGWFIRRGSYCTTKKGRCLKRILFLECTDVCLSTPGRKSRKEIQHLHRCFKSVFNLAGFDLRAAYAYTFAIILNWLCTDLSAVISTKC